MANDSKKNHGFGGGPALPIDPAKGEGPGGFRLDATNVPIPEDEPEKAPARKKAEESKGA